MFLSFRNGGSQWSLTSRYDCVVDVVEVFHEVWEHVGLEDVGCSTFMRLALGEGGAPVRTSLRNLNVCELVNSNEIWFFFLPSKMTMC